MSMSLTAISVHGSHPCRVTNTSWGKENAFPTPVNFDNVNSINMVAGSSNRITFSGVEDLGGGLAATAIFSQPGLSCSGARSHPHGRLGEENFTDLNGNNVFDDGEPFTDKSPDIFRDDNENGAWTSGEPCIGPNTSGGCNTSGDGKYNGVSRTPQNSSPQVLYISNQVVQIFSGSRANIAFAPESLVCPAGGTASVQVKITDVNGNIMPSGTNISFSTVLGSGTSTVTPAAIVIGSGTAPFGVIPMVVPIYNLTIACPAPSSTGTLQVTVTTPRNIETKSSIPIQ